MAATPDPGSASSPKGGVGITLGRLSSPLSRPLAGRRFITIWAKLRCRGRRTGTEYTVPIAIGVTHDVFVVPLPFAEAQWWKNVMAAGECGIRWNGRDWNATDPMVIEKAEARPAFGPVIRFALRWVPIERFLRLRRSGPIPDVR